MAGQSLEFTISASDQASKVVTSVQKKIDNFGKDVGKSIAGVLGPMALVGFAVSKVTDYLGELEKKTKEAFDFGSTLTDTADKLGLTAEQFQRLTFASQATGISVSDFAKTQALAAKRIEEAKNGNEESIDVLKRFGINIEDLKDTKPEDFLAKVSLAMSAVQDPTEKMTISIVALGEAAKGLQDVLNKGFDIQGALGGETGELTNEAARFLNDLRKKEEEKKLRAMSKSARQQATEAFLNEDPEGKAIRDKIIADRMRSQMQGGATSTGITTATGLSNQEDIQARVQAILKARADAKAKSDKAAAEERAKAGAPLAAGALKKAEEDKSKEEEAKKKPDKDKQDKAPPAPKAAKDQTQFPVEMSRAINVSSLREIGGGMAGEVAVSEEQYKQNQLELLREAVRQLEQLNKGPGDFTKARDVAPFNPTKNLA